MSRCKECGAPATWIAPRTSISTDDRGGLFAFLCDRHYKSLLFQHGRQLDLKYEEFVVVLGPESHEKAAAA
jgi:hypothetical protein